MEYAVGAALFDELSPLLKLIRDNDLNYPLRHTLVYEALGVAAKYGLPCGVRIDPKDPEWPVVFLELPTGQVSWHMCQHCCEWDGHTTEEKYQRIEDFTNGGWH